MRRSRVAWRTGVLPVLAVVAGVLGLLWVVLVAAPPWFVHDRSLEGLKTQNEVRTTLLQGLGGIALVAGAYFTYRQLRTAREGQITERYTRAIDQLGHDQLDVRLGGIYALERIARDSSADRTTIGEVLTAVVRRHAPWPPRLPGQYVAAAPIDQVPELQVRAPDVQASLTVLGRGGFARPEDQGDRLDLHASDLRYARLRHAYLRRADLRGAHLERARLFAVNLEAADLRDANLAATVLRNADLGRADLRDAHLERAFLDSANLQGADLRGVHLEGAILVRANLARANLGEAQLQGANLYGAHLDGAILAGATLEGADLQSATLDRANLSGGHWYWEDAAGNRLIGVTTRGAANLRGANLRDASLRWADLAGVHLERAVVDMRTLWPHAFDWSATGVTVAGENTAASPSEE